AHGPLQLDAVAEHSRLQRRRAVVAGRGARRTAPDETGEQHGRDRGCGEDSTAHEDLSEVGVRKPDRSGTTSVYRVGGPAILCEAPRLAGLLAQDPVALRPLADGLRGPLP